jgi:hypothetical protein
LGRNFEGSTLTTGGGASSTIVMRGSPSSRAMTKRARGWPQNR